MVFFFGVGADFRIFWISALSREIREVSQVKKHFVGYPFIFLFFGFFGVFPDYVATCSRGSRLTERFQSRY